MEWVRFMSVFYFIFFLLVAQSVCLRSTLPSRRYNFACRWVTGKVATYIWRLSGCSSPSPQHRNHRSHLHHHSRRCNVLPHRRFLFRFGPASPAWEWIFLAAARGANTDLLMYLFIEVVVVSCQKIICVCVLYKQAEKNILGRVNLTGGTTECNVVIRFGPFSTLISCRRH